MLENVKSWKTTIIGIVTAIIPILIILGVINVEQSEVISQTANTLVEAISAIITAVGSLWLIFKAKDPSSGK